MKLVDCQFLGLWFQADHNGKRWEAPIRPSDPTFVVARMEDGQACLFGARRLNKTGLAGKWRRLRRMKRRA